MIRLRLYGNEDANALIDIWYVSWHSNDPLYRHPEPIEHWISRWHEEIVPANEVAVVHEEGNLLGFCAVNVTKQYLSQLFVHPDGQGNGAGSLLLDWAKSMCPEGLRLHNLTRNTNSLQFYERHGFKSGTIGLDEHSQLETIEYVWWPKN